ncbi:MAG TPA: transposase [Mycobacterium tuberculosis]|uniref:Transposase n=3 Tax=Mycobacterium tuberculosis complex TaxID=77643 RepID=A0A9P2HC58_MYCTX|nr:transposase [Mycobacterium tuberculosis F11]AOZ44808.1 transposase [Mycobacterium tuberculosis]EFD15186.1 transposase [Mycobacterium tuberculosis T46]EFD19289.1 transposase [Mycobacterium tuberculosis CPHL_A]EFD45172.1 transposase [Mycobacterium tuberculosis variant africanum K85]EFD49061.1 transposase [Mycobacterium tuberculosis T17]EFD55277.1 transposase [Mycobacterium tuberculosis 02_1987]EFD60167.1 transposase [Mycobacterium tuberculosis T92]KAK25302.1 transposase [Mycobacterium tube
MSPVSAMNRLRLTKTSPATAFSAVAHRVELADVHARPVGPGDLSPQTPVDRGPSEHRGLPPWPVATGSNTKPIGPSRHSFKPYTATAP